MPLNAEKERELDRGWLMAARRDYIEKIKSGEELSVPRPGTTPPPDPARFDGGEFFVRSVDLPTCWEAEGVPKAFSGPVWYRKGFRIDSSWLGEPERVLIQFEAVSYYCVAWLNGEKVGEHRGMWDRFQLEVTTFLQEENELFLEVHKPGDHFPVRTSLAGFIPYVTTTFGGPWGKAKLVGVGEATVEELRLDPDPAGEQVGVSLSLGGKRVRDELEARFKAAGGEEFRPLEGGEGELEVDLPLPAPRLWSPSDPHLYELEIELLREGERVAGLTREFGMREVSVEGRDIYLNGEPIYPRGVLHWLSYPDLIAPVPGEERISEEILKMKDLGYNMIKACLVLPPQRYLRLADRLGVLIWQEFPLWSPRVDSDFRARAEREYGKMVREVRNHPSVAFYTLGCELSREADAELLGDLYRLVKEETGSPLVRDNSGSPEAYGGIAKEFADFYDYHFYAEANEFSQLIDHFCPLWKGEKPLLFGEYCDSDTFRSVREIKDRLDVEELWWTQDDPVINPQGVRWAYEVVENEAKLAQLSLGPSFQRLKELSYGQSLEYRKDIIEETRKDPRTSGYVVTNIRDTPISTAGMFDDLGETKFEPGEFRRFNRRTLLAFERDRRRRWRAGGDRPQYLDQFNWRGGEELKLNVLVSHYGSALGDPVLSWGLKGDRGSVRRGEIDLQDCLEAGFRGEVGQIVLKPPRPEGGDPEEFQLEMTLRDGGETLSSNRWTIWVFPELEKDWGFRLWDERGALSALDRPLGEMEGVEEIESLSPSPPDGRPIVATAWSERLAELVGKGADLLLLLSEEGGKTVREAPFWREGVEWIEEGGLLDDLPHRGYPGIQFKAITPDRTLKKETLQEGFDLDLRPAVSRLDARDFSLDHYLLTGGGRETGRVVATSFRLTGGFGRQPLGEENVLGLYILERALAFLAGRA